MLEEERLPEPLVSASQPPHHDSAPPQGGFASSRPGFASSHPGFVSSHPARGAGLTRAQLGWLIRLRWLALGGIVVAAVLAAAGAFPGVNWPVLAGVATVATLYNGLLWQGYRRGEAAVGGPAAMGQALVDFALLTLVLWAAGGIRSPFIAYYVFHVALVGILAGPRATLAAAGAALCCAALLGLTELVPVLRIGSWRPAGLWAPLTDGMAFASTVGGVAYLVTHAVRELRDREQALARARDRMALEYELLSTTLNELDAGLEVMEADGTVSWRNKRAQELAAEAVVEAAGERAGLGCRYESAGCERDVSEVCPLERATDHGEPGRCRFAVQRPDGEERVYELLSFPLRVGRARKPRVMNLYLDRTSAMLAERRLLLAERLASLGRVTQGVAHELNTPLATVRTLITDMCAALRAAGTDVPSEEILDDVRESASLIRDETTRLGKITQELLAGGDLVRARINGAVPLAAVVERACALVFAGVREGPRVEIEPGVDAFHVTADPDRLVQVLVNLLQNAYDAVRDEAAACVWVGARRRGDAVELRVEDDGPGIDAAIHPRLFEPFTTTKPPGEGTGLGLYTSYMLVQAMRGSLHIESRAPRGCRAVVALPVSAPRVGSAPTAHAPASERPEGGAT